MWVFLPHCTFLSVLKQYPLGFSDSDNPGLNPFLQEDKRRLKGCWRWWCEGRRLGEEEPQTSSSDHENGDERKIFRELLSSSKSRRRRRETPKSPSRKINKVFTVIY